MKSTISEMTESVEKTLAKKISAEKIIDNLKAEKDLEILRRKAKSFLKTTKKQSVQSK